MNDIYKTLGIDEKVIKHSRKRKTVRFESVKDIIPPAEDYNFQMDYLELPKTKQGYNRLLVMVDLATNELDFEPTKNKDTSTTLKAMKKIFSRPHLNKPYASIRTDKGNEFKGDVKKYLYEQSILHTISLPGRHRQTANVESANREIGKYLNSYMNTKERKTGKTYREWTDIIPKLRTILNRKRKLEIKRDELYEPNKKELTLIENKFMVGDLVYRQLDIPKDARGYDQPTQIFRAGDITLDFVPRKIIRVLYYPNTVRYVLDGITNVSYTDRELVLAEEQEETFEIREIIGEKTIRGKKHYLVWFLGENKKDAIYLPESQLIEDDLEDYIQFYKKKYKKK